MKSEIEKVVEVSWNRLFQIAIPPVRYWLLVDLDERRSDDLIVQKTLAECRAFPPRVRLLETLRADGTWPISKQRMLAEQRGPGPPVGWTYITMLRNLYTLGDYCTDRSEGNVNAVLERILGWQREDGFIDGPVTDAFPTPHYNGFALRDLLQFGTGKDPRTKKLAKWLLRMQRHDGGWNIPYIQDVRYLPQYRQMKMREFMSLVEGDERPPYDPAEYDHTPSCIWSTMMVVRALTWDPKLAASKEAKRGAEFFLDRFFKRNHHPSFLQSEKNWTTLKYPTSFGSGLLALDILTSMNYGSGDERLDKPIKWLLSTKSKDGFWYRSNRPNPEPNQWITETALTILHRYAKSY